MPENKVSWRPFTATPGGWVSGGKQCEWHTLFRSLKDHAFILPAVMGAVDGKKADGMD